MGIKETPTNFRVYYTSMKTAITQRKEEALSVKIDLLRSIKELHEEVESVLNSYKESFNVDVTKYKEYVENKYIDGTFLRLAKGMFINRSNNYELVSDLYTLYNLAKKQKDIFGIEKDIELYDKLLSLTLNQYNEILKTYYTQVQKELVLEGNGYALGNNIGWLCINRCHIERQAPHIDYAATKKRKEELRAAGKKIYNKEEAEWCKQNNIPYDAVDGRVFMRNEYCYEMPLLGCKLPNGGKYKFAITDYRHSSLRGKTNDDLIKMCNNDINKICNLPIDVRTKLNLCLKVDDTLYTKFIRNENQKPIAAGKADRKNR